MQPFLLDGGLNCSIILEEISIWLTDLYVDGCVCWYYSVNVHVVMSGIKSGQLDSVTEFHIRFGSDWELWEASPEGFIHRMLLPSSENVPHINKFMLKTNLAHGSETTEFSTMHQWLKTFTVNAFVDIHEMFWLFHVLNITGDFCFAVHGSLMPWQIALQGKATRMKTTIPTSSFSLSG